MFYDTSAHHRPRRTASSNHCFPALADACRPDGGTPDARQLSRLDDHMLKDIGLSRGSIESAVRNGRSATDKLDKLQLPLLFLERKRRHDHV